MRALITGAAGFIGGCLVRALANEGHDVHPVDIKHGLDLSWPDELRGLPDVDVVFHLAAFTGVRASVKDPLTCMRWNVLGTQNILDWCAKRGVKRLVLASSSSVYGDGPVPFREGQELRPLSPYAASKAACEHLCQASAHLNDWDCLSVLRFFTVYGPNGRKDMAVRRFIEAMQEGKPITINGDGQQRRDFTFVGDVVKAMLEAANWAGYTVANVGAGRPFSVNELVLLLADAMNTVAKVEHGPRHDADVPTTWANTEKLTRLMGWNPTPLHEGLKLTVGAE